MNVAFGKNFHACEIRIINSASGRLFLSFSTKPHRVLLVIVRRVRGLSLSSIANNRYHSSFRNTTTTATATSRVDVRRPLSAMPPRCRVSKSIDFTFKYHSSRLSVLLTLHLNIVRYNST